MAKSKSTCQAARARFEEIVRVLHECGCRIDENSAKRALRYFEAWDRGAADDEHEGLQALVDFTDQHGQSLDWIFLGDPRGTICNGARA